jgi:hypothetical protein
MVTDSLIFDHLQQQLDSINIQLEKIGELATDEINWNYLGVMIGIMLFTGIFGGLANSLNGEKEDRNVFRSIVLGIVATFTIPLFLKIVDSSIITADQNMNGYSILVFGGFCVLAAFYANKFLEGLSAKVLQNLEKKVEETSKVAHEAKDKSDLVIDSAISDRNEDDDKNAGAKGINLSALSGDEQPPRVRIEDAFKKFRLESIETLKRETGLEERELRKILTELESERKIRKVMHNGQEVFGKV